MTDERQLRSALEQIAVVLDQSGGDRFAIEARGIARAALVVPAPHTVLWPPHPGDVYQSSSLCSCGEWQYDADTPGDLFNETRAVQRDWTRHVAQVPAQEERLREALVFWAEGWDGEPGSLPTPEGMRNLYAIVEQARALGDESKEEGS